ncbi:MAG: polyphenol oxidase family protein [Planctomycetota bacterium]
MHTDALLPDLAALVAHHAGRAGGVSEAPFASLNLGFSSGDDRERVLENRRLLGEHLGISLERWVVGAQVHGRDLVCATRELQGEGARTPSRRLTRADAVFLPEPGIFALALSADCPLVLLADPTTRRAGIAHAGWRGTALGVVETLLEAFRDAGSRIEDLVAGISPGICGRCYAVGEEVFAALGHLPGAALARKGKHLDLRRLQRAQLEHAGLTRGAIRVSQACSSCEPERYYSHRRDGAGTGRNGALIGWRE